ncbi:2Fe-2S iron-sulfur cluster-binding protein [Yinghuangia sp. ASG 101]|uniref:(2Fe-2S)-binding protein n=1 Tax=Yinghuangia sp. ASG 101 TaxID=2896848 RepID=UPI001E5AE1DF|nr:(2Fe-2S)-binding protein [Yinghuangia sp. ASG 101]UGQ09587.1 2Fe-2S iron-sulfur cluster-binding protein [Yinghuangia sp. ASG 101]
MRAGDGVPATGAAGVCGAFGRAPMTVPPTPGSGESADLASDLAFGAPAVDPTGPAVPLPVPFDGIHPQTHPTGHGTAYPAPGGGYDTYGTYDTHDAHGTHDTYGAYDPYDPGAGSEIAATSGFGFPVPRPAVAPAPVADVGYPVSEASFAAPEFGTGTEGAAGSLPSSAPPIDHAAVGVAPAVEAAGIPSLAPEFASLDASGSGAVPPPPSSTGPASLAPVSEPPPLPPVRHAFPVSDAPGGPVVSYTIKVNGTTQVVDRAWLGENLLQVLRERLGLPGAKDGCGQGVCGTCTVLVDGAPAVACLVPAATVGERAVTTIEGVSAQGGPAAAIRQALIEHGAVQCGFCVPGIVMSAHALLARLPGADEATIRRALAGHPCRCVGPNRMVAAVCAVAAGQATEPAASLFEPADAPEPPA